MKAKLVWTAGDHLEASIEVNGRRLVVMDDFSGSTLEPGTEFEACVSAGLVRESEPWESMFSGNPGGRRELEPMGGWRYRAFGVVARIQPTVVDCGILELEAPIQTRDERVVGANVAFTIERLDASGAS